jgi:hypothetical protein
VTAAEPYVAVNPHRPSLVGDIAAYHEISDRPLPVAIAPNAPHEAADVG